MEIPQLRVVPADHKIDWGASDFNELTDGNSPPAAFTENTYTKPYTDGLSVGKDGGACGTGDDIPPAPAPGRDVPRSRTGDPGRRPPLPQHLRALLQTRRPPSTFLATSATAARARSSNARLRNLTLKLPPGMIGNPQAAPPCPWAILVLGVGRTSAPTRSSEWCATGSLTTSQGQPEQGRPALQRRDTRHSSRRGFPVTGAPTVHVPPLPIVFAAKQRHTGPGAHDTDIGIDSFTDNIPTTWSAQQQFLKIFQQDITLFPRVAVTRPCVPNCSEQTTDYDDSFPEAANAKPFFTLPTSCADDKTVTVEANSWETGSAADQPGRPELARRVLPRLGLDTFPVTGCDASDPNRPKFDRARATRVIRTPTPTSRTRLTRASKVEQDLDRGDPKQDGTMKAGAPSAYNVTVHMPYTEASNIHGTHLKERQGDAP